MLGSSLSSMWGLFHLQRERHFVFISELLIRSAPYHFNPAEASLLGTDIRTNERSRNANKKLISNNIKLLKNQASECPQVTETNFKYIIIKLGIVKS